MNDTAERILSYAIGGIVGFIGGTLISSAHMTYFDQERTSFLLAVTTLVGILTAVIVVEYRKSQALRENNKVREETVALITHEMRTGLTSTGWAIQLILQNYSDKMSEEDKTLLQGVVESIHTTVMHTINLLDISVLDIGKLLISLEWIKLDKVEQMFKEVLEKYSLGTKRHDIKLISSIHLDKMREVEVDMVRLRIILENLLQNAIQYTLEGKKEITVTITNDALNLNINVSDTGIGIPGADQAKIFTEFFRAENARKKLSSGSGIGLYTCQKYVAAHHGTITFKSKEGQGTTFFITIPLKTRADVNEFLTKI